MCRQLNGWPGIETPRAAYQGAKVDAETSVILRVACNNFAVENTLGHRMHEFASLPEPDEILRMVWKPHSVPDILGDGLTNKM